jgi:hypothetical protein
MSSRSMDLCEKSSHSSRACHVTGFFDPENDVDRNVRVQTLHARIQPSPIELLLCFIRFRTPASKLHELLTNGNPSCNAARTAAARDSQLPRPHIEAVEGRELFHETLAVAVSLVSATTNAHKGKNIIENVEYSPRVDLSKVLPQTMHMEAQMHVPNGPRLPSRAGFHDSMTGSGAFRASRCCPRQGARSLP